jgi:hypothetical protein
VLFLVSIVIGMEKHLFDIDHTVTFCITISSLFRGSSTVMNSSTENPVRRLLLVN